MIRVRIEYTDAAPSIETWPCAYRNREDAMRFADAMDAEHSGVIRSLNVEVSCETHGWHHWEHAFCDLCGWPCCEQDRTHDSIEGWLCGECHEQVEQDRDGECPCGGFCSNCTGVSAHSPI